MFMIMYMIVYVHVPVVHDMHLRYLAVNTAIEIPSRKIHEPSVQLFERRRSYQCQKRDKRKRNLMGEIIDLTASLTACAKSDSVNWKSARNASRSDRSIAVPNVTLYTTTRTLFVINMNNVHYILN